MKKVIVTALLLILAFASTSYGRVEYVKVNARLSFKSDVEAIDSVVKSMTSKGYHLIDIVPCGYGLQGMTLYYMLIFETNDAK